MSIDCSFKSLNSPGSNEILQSQNSLTFKLLKTVADFSQALSTLHDKFGHELQVLVENFRKRNGELRKERLPCPSGLFQVWELFLQQVEVNSQQHGDISRNFCQTIGNGLVERIFHRKIQSKKIFAHRDRIETILLKSNELLLKCYSDYCQAYALALTNPAQYMSEYIASHNVYVHQLQATNGMIHAYQTKTLPKLLEELEECHLDTSSNISSSLLESSEFVYQKCQEQASGYQLIGGACKQANHKQDLAQFVKAAQSEAQLLQATNKTHTASDNSDHLQDTSNNNSSSKLEQDNLGNQLAIRYHQFQSPNLQNVTLPAGISNPDVPKNMQIVPTFKNEIAPDLSQPPSQQQPQLEQDKDSLEEKIEKFEERIESLQKLLARSQESRLHNKVNELQEELSQRRFDLHVAQIHLSAVRSQLQLFEYNYRPAGSAATAALLQPQLVGQSQSVGQSGGNGASSNTSGVSIGGNAIGGGGDLDGGAANSTLALLAANHQMGSNYQLSSISSGVGSSQASGLTRKSSSNMHHNQTAGYRNKWIKAFKSLKEPTTTTTTATLTTTTTATTTGGGSGSQADQLSASTNNSNQNEQMHQEQTALNQQLENQHFFQEYTFKKIASCDVCKDFLRGHMRQGVKCKLCKISSHNDCQSKAHATIKCQQPKIKLLRRQKSAGELEINNSDLEGSEQSNERSSKPDSIYSLIRQVLDAKKRGHPQQQQQQQQQPQHPIHPSLLLQTNDHRGQQLGNSAFMLSTGNLSLANQNGGKSVSTSALQPGPSASGTTTNVSVDRWAVVMELLAQSRKKDKDNYLDGTGTGELGAGGKRHSKQLDKFKSAAKSAAAASRHQYLQQQQQQQQQRQQQQSPQQQTNNNNNSNNMFSQSNQQYGQQQLGPSSSSPLSHQYPNLIQDDYMQQQQQQQPMQHLLQPQQPPSQLSEPIHQGQLHLHHTKSLPIGNKQQQQQQHQQQVVVGSIQATNQQQHHMMSHGLPPTATHHHQLPQMAPLSHEIVAAPSSSTSIVATSSNFGPQSQQNPYHHQQLLGVGPQQQQQQLQSTSAPHSPQRKRFNLRMKSFSLDSPESPSVQQQQPNVMPAAVNAVGSTSSVGIIPASYMHPPSVQQPFEHEQLHQHHQLAMQQQQQQQQLYQSQHMYLNQTSSVGYQQQQPSYLAANYQPASQQRQFDEETSSAYWRQARQQYNHRHSYHNPPFHYQQQQQHHDNNSPSSKQNNNNSSSSHGGSNSNLNDNKSTASGKRASCGGGQQKQRRDSSAGLEPCNLQTAPAKQLAGGRTVVGNASGAAPAAVQQLLASADKNNADAGELLLARDDSPNDYYDLNLDVSLRSQHTDSQAANTSQQQSSKPQQPQSQQQQQQQPSPGGTFVALYDYNPQRADEIQLSAGQLVALVDSEERDWWKIRPLDGSNRLGYFPASYLTKLYPNERPLQVIQTIQVSDGEICDKLLRGQIVMHTGKQLDSFVTIRLVGSNHYIQCPEKYLMEVVEPV